jgi:hypothetical protein
MPAIATDMLKAARLWEQSQHESGSREIRGQERCSLGVCHLHIVVQIVVDPLAESSGRPFRLRHMRRSLERDDQFHRYVSLFLSCCPWADLDVHIHVQ